MWDYFLSVFNYYLWYLFPMEIDIELFRKHLKYLMDKRSFSKKRLSEASGLEISTVRKILNGGTLRLETLIKLSNGLGLYPSELLPAQWQKPTIAIDKTHLTEAIIKTLEFKEAVIKAGGDVSEAQLSNLISILYEKIHTNKPIEADMLQFFNTKQMD